MSDELSTFVYKTAEAIHAIRVVGTKDRPLFVVIDVARAIGRTSKVQNLRGERELHVVQTPGGPQRLLVVTEAGLNRILTCSRLPAARQFHAWVVREVLPAIRKDQLSAALRELESQRERVAELERQITVLTPHAYRETVKRLLAEGGRSMRAIARQVGVSPQTVVNIRNRLDTTKPRARPSGLSAEVPQCFA